MADNHLFKIKKSDVDRISGKVTDIITRERKVLVQKVTDITNVVFQTAHSKRALITKQEQKASGRTKRVSDPNAPIGVPVDTGSLQAALKKEVKDTGKGIEGSVFVDEGASNSKTGESVIEYAKFMEFGTSRIAPRSFLRSAIHVNKDWIKKYWHTKQ